MLPRQFFAVIGIKPARVLSRQSFQHAQHIGGGLFGALNAKARFGKWAGKVGIDRAGMKRHTHAIALVTANFNIPFDEIVPMMADGRIRDAKTVILLQHALLTGLFGK